MDSVIRGTSASITQSATVVADVDQSGTVRRTHVRVDGSGEKTDVVTVGAKVWVRDGQGWSASNEKNDVDLGTLANPFSRYLDIAVFADTAYQGSDRFGHHFSVDLRPGELKRYLRLYGEEEDVSAFVGMVSLRYDLWTNDAFVATRSVMVIRGDDMTTTTTVLSRLNEPASIPKVG